MSSLTCSVLLDLYESGVRSVTDAQRELARIAAWEPIRSLAAACADVTRDTAAIQLSTARWLLDL
jgi:hypothetical protein